jgi:hypothetical protein
MKKIITFKFGFCKTFGINNILNIIITLVVSYQTSGYPVHNAPIELRPCHLYMKAFGEATPESARSNRHPSSRTDVSSIPATSEPSNLTPLPTVTESKGAEPPTREEEEEFPV